MGQKVNPVKYRIGVRANWASLWSVYCKNYKGIYVKDVVLRQAVKKMINYLGLLVDDVSVRFCSKNCVLVQPNTKSVNTVIESSSTTTDQMNSVQNDTVINEQVAKNRLALKLFGFVNRSHLLIKPTAPTEVGGLCYAMLCFISWQIKLPIKSRTLNFKRGLNYGLTNLMQSAVYSTKITGAKILCKGRWSKTPSGRRQRLSILIGTLNSSQIKTKLTYASTSIVTSYGKCSISIWVSL